MNTYSEVNVPTLKELRKRSYLSQEDLARVSRVPRESISRFENGRKKPGPKTLQALAGALRVEPRQIVFTDSDRTTSGSHRVSAREKLELFRLVLDNGIRELLPEVTEQDIVRYFGKKKIAEYITRVKAVSTVTADGNHEE